MVLVLITENKGVQGASLPAIDQQPVYKLAIQAGEAFPAAVSMEFGLGSEYSWKMLTTEYDKSGAKHTRYQQVYRGIVVPEGMLILHEKSSGKFITGNFVRLNLPEHPSDLDKTLKQINTRYFESGQRLTSGLAKGIFIWLINHAEKTARVAFTRDYFPANSLERQTLIVDAVSLTIIAETHTSCHADVTGTAHTAYYGIRNLPTFQNTGAYILKNTSRGSGIFTKNLNYQLNYQYVNEFSDTDNNWNQPSLPGDQFATDAHFCAVHYYDFLLNRFNRNSLDDNGYPLVSYLNYGTSLTNAFWNGQAVVYGSGSMNTTPLTTLDITGHEFTHGLIQKTAGLHYSGEPGTINEALSDIFGVALEHDLDPLQANWLIGEQSGTTLRSFSDPGSYNQPGYYHGTHWYFGSGDQGGVHINSGFINKWFYILAQGEQATNEAGNNYHVSGIGIGNATDLVYHMLTTYLFPSSGFDDLRVYSLQSAIDLYGYCSEEYTAVLKAWDAVGLGNSQHAPAIQVSGTTSMCQGDSVALFVTHYPGNTYNWYCNGQPMSSGTIPSNFITQPGSWHVTVQGCNGITSSFTVIMSQHLLPPVAVANAVTCPGIPVMLQGIPAGGSFSIPNPHNGGTTGFTYSVTDTNGCSAYAAGTVTVLQPDPVQMLNNPSIIPVNDEPVLLVADQPGTFSGNGVTGNYFNPQGMIAGSVIPVYVTAAGNQGCMVKDSVLFTITEPCTKDHEGITVEADRNEVASGTLVELQLNNAAADFRIQWLLPENCIAVTGTQSESVKFSVTDSSATITVQLINSCNDTIVRQLQISVTGEQPAFEMELYPNPASAGFQLRIPSAIAPVNLIITNASGKTVISQLLNSEINYIDTRHFSKGLYLVTVTGNKQIIRKKLVVQ